MKTWKDISGIHIPTIMQGLPRDSRGYVIPWSVAVGTDGKPDFRMIDQSKLGMALKHKVCALCGTPLGEHLAFVGGPISFETHCYVDSAMHVECAQYALEVCPFLAAPKFGYAKHVKKAPKGYSISHVDAMGPDRPDVFVMGVTTDFRLASVRGSVVLVAGAWVYSEEWALGVMKSGPVNFGESHAPDTI